MTSADLRNKRIMLMTAGALAVVIVVGLIGIIVRARAGATTQTGAPSLSQTTKLEIESGIDPGTSLNGVPAPDFTLTDQFGRQDSLSQFRGKVVVIAFTDSECTTICPLTSQSLLESLRLLPADAAQHVQLLGVNANPDATSVADVKTYSVGHGLENKWLFMTGAPAQLSAVWKAYHIYVQIVNGNIDHTPAVFVIDSQGREQKIFATSGQYGVVGVEAFALADAVAPLLPGHVAPPTKVPVQPPLDSTHAITLPKITAQGTQGTVTLGPGNPQLLFFFASWSSDIQSQLEALNTIAQTPGEPRVIAVDIGSTESSPTAAQTLLKGLATPLAYPVAYDQIGNVADAYDVQDIPWLALSNASGQIIGSHDGWESVSLIEQGIQQDMAKGATPTPTV